VRFTGLSYLLSEPEAESIAHRSHPLGADHDRQRPGAGRPIGSSEQAPDFPLKVKGPSRGATNALGTSLEARLMHVVPREHD
jgi:hypothetical protein